MAGGLDFHKPLEIKGQLKPATTSLQNCLRFSHDYRYLGLLCDFGLAIIIKLQESDFSTSSQANIHKTLEHDNGETLEGQSWSQDCEVYAVIGHKAYLYQVSNDFNLLHVIQLYYVPKDIALATTISTGEHKSEHVKYKAAIAGPNGVEIYDLEMKNATDVKEGLHLHADLAIVLVEFSPDLQYLAVAALDCHFGIWNVQSLEGEQKDFWFKHLSTVRITNIAFSSDSQSIAVACWDGVCYLFTRAQPSTQGNKTSQWIQHTHMIQSSGERVCGMLTGSLVCWAPHSKSVRFSFTNDEGSWLNTLDVEDGKNWTEQVAKKDIEVKGIDTLRCSAGDFSVCYLSTQQLLLTRWNVHCDNKVISCISHKASREVPLYEDLVCSVCLLPEDPKQNIGTTMRWRCHSDEELQQVKDLRTMFSSVNCGNDEGNKTRVSNYSCDLSDSSSSWNPEKPKKESTPSLSNTYTCTVRAPFYGPSSLLSNRSGFNPKHFVLASRTCVVIVTLPSLAYVYYQKSNEWRSVVFVEAVSSCCLVHENILATLSTDGVLSAWDLTKSSCIARLDSLPIQSLQTERTFVVGDPFQSLVLVFDVDAQQEGTVAHVSLQDDVLVLVKKGPVCIPPSITSCSMLGLCVFFYSKDFDTKRAGMITENCENDP